jgi:hypothetical protein
VLRLALQRAGIAPTVEFGLRTELPHGRCFRLIGAHHHLDLVLDQGFGFWQPTRRTPYDFQADDNVQVRALSETAFAVAGEHDRVTDIFVDLKPNADDSPI